MSIKSEKRNKICLIILHSILPITIGALIYLFYRKTTLLVFQWIDIINLKPVVIYLRELFNPHNNLHSNFYTHNLPDALWVYSFTSFFIITYGMKKNHNIIIYCIPLIIAVTSEILQLIEFIPGTFDYIDVFSYIGSSIISILYLTNKINYK
tara:strand:- start:153 stop:608 length:456 start_codon:yes stop_codon:yes gene_type:complete